MATVHVSSQEVLRLDGPGELKQLENAVAQMIPVSGGRVDEIELLLQAEKDTNLMPIMDRILGSGVHAIQCVDPLAGMDIIALKKELQDIQCLGDLAVRHMAGNHLCP